MTQTDHARARALLRAWLIEDAADGPLVTRSAFALWALVLALLVLLAGALQGQALPLVQQADLVYEGAFRLPAGGSQPATFDGGGLGLAYNQTNHSLFVSGHVNGGYIAEVNIPTPSMSTSVGSLPVATFRQSFADPLAGKRCQVGDDGGGCPLGGLLVDGSRLIVTIDADMGTGVRGLTGLLDVTVLPSEAVTVELTAGTPTEQ